MKRVYIFVIQVIFSNATWVLSSCENQKINIQELQFNEGDSTVSIKLEKILDTLYVLHADIYWQGKKIQSSKYDLPYAIYQFQLGDIDNNGQMDIAVGVIKRTYYDSISRKRPFFFKLYKGNLRPLWLGSRLAQPIEDFRIKKLEYKNVLQSIEIERNGRYLTAQYAWTGFGFRFEKFLCRNLTKEDAYKLLTK